MLQQLLVVKVHLQLQLLVLVTPRRQGAPRPAC
jgi:hypothetical protein